MKIGIMVTLFGIVMLTYAMEQGRNDFETGIIIGKNIKANRYQNLYFSGQPGMDEFDILKKQGFVAVVNLRTREEFDEIREKIILDELNIRYINVPIDLNDPLTDDQVQTISQFVLSEDSNAKILVHCKSGNRVGVWVGAHFFKYKYFSKDEALKIAVQMGLSTSQALERLKDYLEAKFY